MRRGTTKKRRSKRRSKSSSLVRVTSDRFEFIYVLESGTLLHTGTADGIVSFPLFLTPHKTLAKMYAGAGGEVISFRTTRPLHLMSKSDVLWGVRRGAVPRGEWEGFGTDESDFPVAKALCRRNTSEAFWVYGLDGWVHKYSSPTLGEVLVCDASALNVA